MQLSTVKIAQKHSVWPTFKQHMKYWGLGRVGCMESLPLPWQGREVDSIRPSRSRKAFSKQVLKKQSTLMSVYVCIEDRVSSWKIIFFVCSLRFGRPLYRGAFLPIINKVICFIRKCACVRDREVDGDHLYLLRWLWNFTLRSVWAEYVILRVHGPSSGIK